jgi:hypothetical protein
MFVYTPCMVSVAAPNVPGQAPPDQAALDALELQLAEVCGHINALKAELTRLVAEAIQADAWTGWGIHSPSQWVAWKTGVSPSNAKQLVALAARRDELPATFGAFGAGQLSIDQVAPIVAKVPAWADAEVCELAKQATVTQIRSVVRSYPFDAATPKDEDLAPDRPAPSSESLSLLQHENGRWSLHGELDHDHGLVVDAAMREARDALFRRNGEAPTAAEVLVEMAQRSLDTVDEPGRRDRYRVHIHLDAATGEAVDALGHRIPASLRQQLCCDSTVGLVLEHGGLPVSVGRAQPIVPSRTRRLVTLRDRGCRVPGCGSAGFLEVHHVIHREHGGPTDTWNLVCLCPRHHRLHHQGALGIVGDADQPIGHPGALRFTDANGNPLRAGPSVRPPESPPPVTGSRYEHPPGERIDRRWISFHPPTASGTGNSS